MILYIDGKYYDTQGVEITITKTEGSLIHFSNGVEQLKTEINLKMTNYKKSLGFRIKSKIELERRQKNNQK